ncbi:unnamed protein product [Caenorhabditis bovis]|uniref:Uncharacterized protein n=1 Tax=Caenorhabditis bovis TaxID=2654633 RepID=A0A8S1F163_9PELO|nr:unnamed protein product [Caenorhabditis bovis]
MNWCSESSLDQVHLSSEPIYLIVQIAQILQTIACPLLLWLMSRRYGRVYLNANLKCLLNFHKTTAILYCLSFSIIQTYHVISRLFLKECDLLVPDRVCIWFRIVQSWATNVFQMFYIAVSLEVLLGIAAKKLYNSIWTARSLGILTYILSFCAVFPSLAIDLKSTNFLANCASFENKGKLHLKTIFMWFISLDVLSLISMICLKLYIECVLANKRFQYDVNRKVERKELRRCFNLMLPNIILHTACYLYFSISWMLIFDQFEQLQNPQFRSLISNIIPFYVFCTPIIWCIVLHYQKKKFDVLQTDRERDVYFCELNRQWGPQQTAEPTRCFRKHRVTIIT